MNTPTAAPSIRGAQVMLARLVVRSWTAKRLDVNASTEVAKTHTKEGLLPKDIGRFNKRLILKDAVEFNRLLAIESEARQAFHHATLDYDGDGVRLLPVKAYLELVADYDAIKAKFESQRDRFLAKYPEYKEDARQALNGLFRESDYPTAEEMLASFSMKLMVWPFPEAHHFTVDSLPPSAAARIREQIEESRLEALERSRDEITGRLREVIAHVCQRMEAVAGGGRLHDSTLDNLRETLDILPKLNFLDDPKIADAISFAKAKLLPYSSNGVRANRALAFPIAAAAREVAAKIDSDFAFDLSAFGAAPTGDSAKAEATPELAGLFA